MSKEPIQIESFINRSDYNPLRNYYLYKSKPTRTKIVVFTLLGSLLLLVLSESQFGFPFFKMLGILGILVDGVLYTLVEKDGRKFDKRAKFMLFQKQQLKLSEDAFSVKWKGITEEIEYEWNEVQSAVENDSHFYLFVEQYLAIIIPKLELKEFKIKQIRNLIESKIEIISDLSGYKHQI